MDSEWFELILTRFRMDIVFNDSSRVDWNGWRKTWFYEVRPCRFFHF